MVICAFSGSGIVLYNGFFNKPRPQPGNIRFPSNASPNAPGQKPSASAAGKASDQLLPNGKAWDLKILDRPYVEYGVYNKKNTVSESEIGISQFELVAPLELKEINKE